MGEFSWNKGSRIQHFQEAEGRGEFARTKVEFRIVRRDLKGLSGTV